VPSLLGAVLPVKQSSLSLLQAAGLLIVAGTVREVINLIETELRMHGYDDHLIA